ncbi:Annexin [Hypoxylon sp. NC0597]|nr:Annexin [Hypoxylon sp. NC0597]
MSLHVGDSARRGRSPSPARASEGRDHRRGRADSPSLLDAVRMPSPPAGFSYDDAGPRRPTYDHNGPRGTSYRPGSPTDESSYYRASRESIGSIPDVRYARHSEERVSRGDKDMVEAAQDVLRRGADAFLPSKYASKLLPSDGEREKKKERKKEKLEEDLAYGSAAPVLAPSKYSSVQSPTSGRVHYSMPGQWEDEKDKLRYPRVDTSYAPPLPERPEKRSSYGLDPRMSGARVVTAEPGSARRDHSPLPPTGRMSSLTVNTGRHSGSLSLSSAPPSPLLESYHGTYQSMSPMPSPLLLAQQSPRASDIIEPLSPSLSDGESNSGEKKRRRARFHDPVDDAARLAKALKGEHFPPDTEPLIEILPGMTHEQIMELRVEYKRLVKTGPERKGVNVAKHIRARLKDEDPTLMKACYTVALGKWESEAYWANFWYHGDKTRRELLIESLMGRTNSEIAQIKEAFSDKKYRDSLTLCMKTELKEDKFKRAVLMVLEEKRMEDVDEYGRPVPVNRELVQDDVEALYKAVRSDRGGETAMIQIVVSRSDNHLKEVLRLYEKVVGSNFARDALRKSGNLVGELLAHILNGIINKPVRDALLLHHALTASKKDHLRRELLISRLVRFHWDRHHMAAIKRAYRERYGEELSEAVKEGTSGEWGLFCEQLVVTRMPDDVKSFEKVEAEREWEREKEKEREREERHRRKEKERHSESDRERKEKKKDREREKERKSRSEGLLVVKEHKHRDGSRSRERSRSRSQRRE